MEVQFIHSNAVKTTIQVITVMSRMKGDHFQWGRPAALSTDNPRRNLQGHWKNKLCLAIEREMRAYRAIQEMTY